MTGAACLHADKTRAQLGEERQKLRSSQSPARDDFTVLGDRMNLEDVLRQV